MDMGPIKNKRAENGIIYKEISIDINIFHVDVEYVGNPFSTDEESHRCKTMFSHWFSHSQSLKKTL